MGLRVAPAFTAPLVVRLVAGFRAAFFLPGPVAPPFPGGPFTAAPFFALPRALPRAPAGFLAVPFLPATFFAATFLARDFGALGAAPAAVSGGSGLSPVSS